MPRHGSSTSKQIELISTMRRTPRCSSPPLPSVQPWVMTSPDKLPHTIRVLLESAVRNCDEFHITKEDVEKIIGWEKISLEQVEIPFKPSRVILQDFTGVPVLVDLASMRDAMSELGGDPDKINPMVPADLVIDHSVTANVVRSDNAIQANMELEFERNNERFTFLKWGSSAFHNMLIIPPGSGIVHQVNLEYLARVVFNKNGIFYPDSVLGTDSHTTMINGLGVLGWGVGGIDAEAAMLGQAEVWKSLHCQIENNCKYGTRVWSHCWFLSS